MTVKALKRILVANRGEIACRVFKTATELGYETVAVYSEADAGAPHVDMADTAVCIGAAAVAESYLCADKILAAAKETEADAVHPGYGFLSENADFARACEAAGLTFIGPSAEAIDLMGNKAAAKRHMLDAGVPCVPGYQGSEQSEDALLRAANEIGFPVMVKAAAGGGGKGMRLVDRAAELPNALAGARSEALNAFGSDELILEKAITEPRHVEFQVFGDAHGNIVHMGERDCSVQRRHQKVIEEAPCPVMSCELRTKMGEAAVNAAKSIGYRGAGTVEFLLDRSDNFYFLEMNTRLQVEHPVTELVTGFDLVALQLAIAEGRVLGVKQSDFEFEGHAIEVRLYAEDPTQQFLPVSGQIQSWKPSDTARTDSGINAGMNITPFYDPMLAKVIARGDTREQARLKLVGALKETVLFGTVSNQAFLIDCLEDAVFIAGQATTGFIEAQFPEARLNDYLPMPTELAVAAVLVHFCSAERTFAASLGVSVKLRNWASASLLTTPVCYEFGGTEQNLFVKSGTKGFYEVSCGEENFQVSLVDVQAGKAGLLVDGKKIKAFFKCISEGELYVAVEGRPFRYLNKIYAASVAEDAAEGGAVAAPMHGLVLEVNVAVGAKVKTGDCLAVLEAMKMQHQITARIDGVVEAVCVTKGMQIATDKVMFEIKKDEDTE